MSLGEDMCRGRFDHTRQTQARLLNAVAPLFADVDATFQCDPIGLRQILPDVAKEDDGTPQAHLGTGVS